MFFVVRLALSELVMFGAAYAVTGTGTLALVTTYLLPVLNTGSRPWSPPCRIGLPERVNEFETGDV